MVLIPLGIIILWWLINNPAVALMILSLTAIIKGYLINYSPIFEIIDIVQGNDMVLASGYISPLETMKLFGAAKDHGVRKMIVTHPEELPEDQLENLTTLGAYMEYSFLSCMPLTAKISPMGFSQQILKAGIERSVVTTAFGQPVNPPPSEGMRMAIAALLDSGMSSKHISRLVKDNPSELLS